MKRRSVLKWMAALPAAYALPLQGSTLPQTPLWENLKALQHHLLPGGDGAPSADAVNAAEYLHMTMRHQSFDHEVRDFILQGVGWIEYEATTLYGQSFAMLGTEEREGICRVLVDEYRRGEAWLSTLVTYTLEALLSDPLYGGNTDGIGWTWLDHVPGEPRPAKRFVHGV